MWSAFGIVRALGNRLSRRTCAHPAPAHTHSKSESVRFSEKTALACPRARSQILRVCVLAPGELAGASAVCVCVLYVFLLYACVYRVYIMPHLWFEENVRFRFSAAPENKLRRTFAS